MSTQLKRLRELKAELEEAYTVTSQSHPACGHILRAAEMVQNEINLAEAIRPAAMSDGLRGEVRLVEVML